MQTYSAKPSDIQRKWYVIDAENVVLGRLASQIALRLRGKHKPMFTTNLDCGDNIIVVNAAKIKLTGRKLVNKKYFWHTGYPGGIKERTAEQVIDGRFPERVVVKAVERMLDRGPMGRKQMTKLYVYAGNEHPHTAQQPEAWDVGAMNPKNRKEQ